MLRRSLLYGGRLGGFGGGGLVDGITKYVQRLHSKPIVSD